MKHYKTKGNKPKICPHCNKQFFWTRPFEAHYRLLGEKSCITPFKKSRIRN